MLFAVSGLVGCAVKASDGDIGAVKDFLFDDNMEDPLDGGRRGPLAVGPSGADPPLGNCSAGSCRQNPASR